MKSLITVTVLALMLPISAQAVDKKEASPYIGKHLYRSFCAVCHGRDGKTKGPLAEKMQISPPDLTSGKYQKKNVDELTEIISGYGRKEGSEMPSWSTALPDASIRHIAAYIGSMTLSELRLVSDIGRGRLIYKNTCASCHGTRGKGNGILAVMMRAKMVDFTKKEVAKRLTDKQLIEVISKGRGKLMPGWAGTLNDSEIVDVSAYVRSLLKKR